MHANFDPGFQYGASHHDPPKFANIEELSAKGSLES